MKPIAGILGRVGCVLLCAAALSGFGSGTARAASDEWQAVFFDSKLIFDSRYRFEHVDQKGVAKNARANTVRTRAGLETGRVHGIGAGFDVEWIEALGSAFNDTLNGKVQYPVVADPEDFQLNQAYLISKDTIPGTMLKVGRQRIIWDDARFVGNVGFRQNEQTFDAVRAMVTALPDTEIEYMYLDEVHRIFGSDSPVGDLGLKAHGARLSYTGFPGLVVTPFALLLDYNSGAFTGLDLASYGVLAGFSHKLDEDWTLLASGSAAHQEDYADNPFDIDLWYYRIEGGAGYRATTLKAGYEVLEGDGARAFQTPLATGHKFNGLTDKFLVTPPNGLEDFYLSLSSKLPLDGWLSDIVVKADYHQYRAEQGNAHYGWEWDAGIFKTVGTDFGKLLLGLQYASYQADKFATDTDKLWITVQFTADPHLLGRTLAGAPN